MKQRWYILGAGSIGCLWACHLIKAGYPVTLILRDQKKLNTFAQSKGIILADEHFSVEAEIANNPSPIHQLLITTKSTDTEIAFNSVKSRLANNTKVVVLQNGLGSQEWIKSQLPQGEVVWASTTDGAWMKSPFHLVHAGKGVTRIGSPSIQYPWIASLKHGLLSVQLDEDIAATLWRKLAINCAINPLTAVYNCRNGDLVKKPDYLATMATICKEVESVAQAEGIELFDGPLIEQACHVAELTAENYSSMLQDIRHNRTTEISHITGYLCRLAKHHNLQVPSNSFYLNKIKKMHDSNKQNQN
jgi:2-dehydropantoate 2-reductase